MWPFGRYVCRRWRLHHPDRGGHRPGLARFELVAHLRPLVNVPAAAFVRTGTGPLQADLRRPGSGSLKAQHGAAAADGPDVGGRRSADRLQEHRARARRRDPLHAVEPGDERLVPPVTGRPTDQTSSLALPQMLVAESSGLVTPVQAAPSLCSVADRRRSRRRSSRRARCRNRCSSRASPSGPPSRSRFAATPAPAPRRPTRLSRTGPRCRPNPRSCRTARP